MEIQLNRQNNAFHYEASNAEKIKVQIDSAAEIGGEGKGVRPMELLLMGLGGCSAIDVGLILKKQRQVVDDIQISISANRQENVIPSLFESIHVRFMIMGNLDAKKVARAVELSMTKYCSVTKTLEATAEITYSILINNHQIL